MDRGLLERLRTVTGPEHGKLDALLEEQGVLRDPRAFASHLEVFGTYLMQRRGAPLPEGCMDGAYYADVLEQRLDEVLYDLRVWAGHGLEASVQGGNFSGLAARTLHPWAVCYLVEGSRLGGQAIATALRRSGVRGHDGCGVDALRSVGQDAALVRDRWQQFCARLGRVPEGEHTRVVEGAVLEFQSLRCLYEAASPC